MRSYWPVFVAITDWNMTEKRRRRSLEKRESRSVSRGSFMEYSSNLISVLDELIEI